MEGIPPADLGKLVNAQQIRAGITIRTANHTPRPINHTLGQQPNLRVDRMECNTNLKSTGVENGRYNLYRQGICSESGFDSRKEGNLECYNHERRYHFEQEGPPDQAHVNCKSNRGSRQEKSSRYLGNMSSDGCSSEDSLQTDDTDRTKEDMGSSSSLSCANSAYSSSTNSNTDNHSLPARSDLSTASTMMCPQPLFDCSPSLPSSLPPQPLRPGSTSLSSKEKSRKTILQQNALNDPDRIIWSDTKKYVVQWNKEGKLGFTIKNVKGRDGSEEYAMVTSLIGPSAQSSGLERGDRVLSINGTPIHQHQTEQAAAGISASEVFKKQSRDSPVSIIIQRPQSTRVRSVANSVKSSLKTVSSQVSFRDTFKNDDRPMMRLPDLRLVIMGSNSENMAEQLVGSKIWSGRQDGPISKRCCVKIQKKDRVFEYLSCKSHQVMDILKSLENQRDCHNRSNSIRGSLTVPECVVLEVVVVKDSRFADYCNQLVMTSHSMYIVEFDGQSFLQDTEKHVRELQGKLNKIRTYAGSESPVYLISSWQHLSADTLESVKNIGTQLQQRFEEAFGGQLQYHGNCPCFMLSRALSSQVPPCNQCKHLDGRVDLTVRQDQVASSVVKFCNQSSTSTATSSSSVFSSLNSCSTCFSDCGPEACLILLREHISRNVFEQRFLTRNNYPQKFLSFRDIVIELRDQKQKCIMTSGVKKECGVSDSEELTSLLEYLHKQGVIILPANEKDEPHRSFVALNPEDLVHTCQRLLDVPEVSHQDQSLRQHWNELQTKSILTQPLLTHLLGMESDAACITACLQQLNLIHDYSVLPPNSCRLSCDSPRTERRSSQQALYLLPFHINNLMPRGSTSCKSLSERILLADFKGYCPHGLFSKLAIELGRVASEKDGTFEFLSETSWNFNMGGNYTVYMRDDPSRCMVKFIIEKFRCNIGFSLQNVLIDIRTAIMKVMRSNDCFTLGPPCPMDHRCKFQREMSSLAFPHILDLSKEYGEHPLWCGDEDVRKFKNVRQWIVSQLSQGKQKRTALKSSGMILCKDTPYSHLPPDLIQLVCNKMNLSSIGGRNWRGLAGQLGYTISDVKCFEEALLPHQYLYDPCGHLLEDWGKSGNATIGNLISNLEQPNLNRQDVIQEIKEKWKIVDH